MGAVATLNALNRDDYDMKYSVNETAIRCYSKSGLKKQYPKGNYYIVGETFEHNQKEKIATIMLGGKILPVSDLGSNFKPFFKRTGYIEVGENAYLALLKNQKVFTLLCSGLLSGILAMVVILAVLWFTAPTNKPDFLLPPEDVQAADIENDHSQKKKATGGGAVSLNYSLDAQVDLLSKQVSILLQNPNASNKDMTVTLYIQTGDDALSIAHSGLVKAGKELRTMSLNLDGIALQSGIYKGYFILDFYDPASGDKALMNSKIDHVKITVNS